MLILTRRVNESVVITHPDGTEVTVTVLGMVGNQIRLGFEAPKEVKILRDNAVDRSPGVVRSSI